MLLLCVRIFDKRAADFLCTDNMFLDLFFGLAYRGKDFVFRFIIEYSSLLDLGLYVISLFLYEDF